MDFQLGWNDFFVRQLAALQTVSGCTGRVCGEEKGLYRIWLSRDVTVLGTVPGRLAFRAGGRLDFPAVGDWVWCEPAGDGHVQITQIFERHSLIARGATDGGDVQIIATNVDWMIITTSANGDLNYNRLDRYLTLATNSACTPVIALTKTDLHPDPSACVRNIEARYPEVAVLALTAHDEQAVLERLAPYLEPGMTAVLVGSSGVGKSTLTNLLARQALLKTQAIRADDERGRHTTTTRHMVALPSGAVIIDTPGMRELQVLVDEEGLSEHFGDIDALIQRCRFSDCAHRTEPRCQVLAALDDGRLEESRWRNFLKLQAEVRFATNKHNKAARSEEKKRWAKITKNAREGMKWRGK